MTNCPLGYKESACTGPGGWYTGCVKDGKVMCRVTEYALAKNLLIIADRLNKPTPLACEGCDKAKPMKEG